MSLDENKKTEKLMVLVSPSHSSAYLIRRAYDLAGRINVGWIALYVESPKPITEKARVRLSANLNLAAELKAEVISTSNRDVVHGAVEMARQNNVTTLIVGKSRHFSPRALLRGGSLSQRFARLRMNFDIILLAPPVTSGSKTPFFGKYAHPPVFARYLTALLSVLAITVINLLLVGFLGYWTIALIYLLFVSVYTLFTSNFRAVLLTAALSALLWNFLFIPPLYTFNIGKFEDTLMFIMYFAIAIIIAVLNSKLRLKENILRSREKRISALYYLSNEMEKAEGFDEILCTGVRYISGYFGAKFAVLLNDGNGNLLSKPHQAGSLELTTTEYEMAVEVLSRKEKPDEDSLYPRTGGMFYLPLVTSTRVVGILIMRINDANKFTLEQEMFLRNITHQFAVVLEREILSAINRKNVLLAESEKLYGILLSSVSHELRTPLTTITGAATSLLDSKIDANPETRRSLVWEIKMASDRLNRLVDNLLDMSRLEAGMLKLERQAYDINEVITHTLGKLKDELAGHPVQVQEAASGPLVRIDFMLTEQAIANIIYNAVVHTPPGTRICVRSFAEDGFVHVEVSDNGPGLKRDELPSLFDKFRRGSRSMHSGTGIGLAICKGIIEAHNGKVCAQNNSKGGALFRLSLPADEVSNREGG